MRLAVYALALAGLTLLAAGVLDAAPLVFWGTRRELASIEHGRSVMLAGAALIFPAVAGLARLGRHRAAALLALAAALPTASVLAAPRTALGLLALVPAVGLGFGAALAGSGERPLVPSAVLGLVALGAAAANGLAWGVVVAGTLTLGAYWHARAGGRGPRAAAERLLPGAGFAALTALAVFAGAWLAG